MPEWRPLNWRGHPQHQAQEVIVNPRFGFRLDGHLRFDLALEDIEPSLVEG